MHGPGRDFVRELVDGIRDAVPDRGTIVIAAGRELVGARGAFHVGVPAVALEHKVCGAPDFDFRYHAGQKLLLDVPRNGFRRKPGTPSEYAVVPDGGCIF